ncbi:MAG: adenylate kinase [Alphaproteobacteria bacterium]|nr:adenylate kinase [Alphaproteobacteria bacterium]MDD9920299.1 adenylate kinase [Alphaproteobacteria bacterium]
MSDSSYQRVMIIGPSSSGKSTLALKLGEQLKAPVLHLDQIAHKPNTHWERTPIEDFVAKHDTFIEQPTWVVEGNYSVCMPQRIAAADVVIWCDPSLLGCLWRYARRSFNAAPDRAGRLEGAKGEFSWKLILYTVRQYPRNKLKYQKFLADSPDTPLIHLKKFSDIKKFSL